MNKHVKLFESFQNEQTIEELKLHMIAERVFSNLRKKGIDFSSIGSHRLYEQDEANEELYNWLYQEVEPNAAELRAAGRGYQILSRPQLAVMYLYAIGANEEHGDATEYIQVIPGIEDYVFQGLPKYKLNSIIAEIFGIDSDNTFTKTVKKFSNHITGAVEDPEALRTDMDYRKVRDAYRFLSRFGHNDVALSLGDAVQGEARVDQRMEQAANRQERLADVNRQRRLQRQAEDLKIGETIFRLRNSYASAFPGDTNKLSRIVWQKAVEENPNLDLNRMWDSYLAYLRSMGIRLRDNPLNGPRPI